MGRDGVVREGERVARARPGIQRLSKRLGRSTSMRRCHILVEAVRYCKEICPFIDNRFGLPFLPLRSAYPSSKVIDPRARLRTSISLLRRARARARAVVSSPPAHASAYPALLPSALVVVLSRNCIVCHAIGSLQRRKARWVA